MQSWVSQMSGQYGMAQLQLNQAIYLEQEETEKKNGNTPIGLCSMDQWMPKVTDKKDNTECHLQKSRSTREHKVLTEIQLIICKFSLIKYINSSAAPYLISVLASFTSLSYPFSLSLFPYCVSLNSFHIPNYT